MLPLYEACESLGVRPKTFRQLLSEFGDLIEGPRPRAGGGQEIPSASVELLRRALELRSKGRSTAEIRAVLAEASAPSATAATAEAVAGAPVGEAQTGATAAEATGEAALAATVAAPAAPPVRLDSREGAPVRAPGEGGAEADWAEKIARLEAELARSEERRIEDRDRILTALARAQQEIQHLRFELAAGGSRKDRRKRGFWSRLFG